MWQDGLVSGGLTCVCGRTGPFEVAVDLEESMEFVEPEADGPAEESAEEGVTDDETDLGVDWETVPSPRFCDIPSQVDPHLVDPPRPRPKPG